jgi:amidase
VVFKYGMKRDFNAWLASLGDRAPVKSLTALREWNRAHQSAGTLKYGQAQLDNSDEMDLTADHARYQADRAKDLALSRDEGIDAVMKAHKLDALIFPGGTGAAIAAKAGYPTVIVPFGTVPNSVGMPAGFNAKPSPYGVAFTGGACSEPRLIEIAYAFEQATKRRIPPSSISATAMTLRTVGRRTRVRPRSARRGAIPHGGRDYAARGLPSAQPLPLAVAR